LIVASCPSSVVPAWRRSSRATIVALLGRARRPALREARQLGLRRGWPALHRGPHRPRRGDVPWPFWVSSDSNQRITSAPAKVSDPTREKRYDLWRIIF